MIFSIFVILLIAVSVYFHYLQGFFSAAISAVLAIVAAVIAVGTHEAVVSALLGGKIADTAHALVMVAMFAGIYVLLRFIADKLVPGNVQFPFIVDKVCSAAMGLIAGIFAVGVATLAAQNVPLGPSIAGYSRYPVINDIRVTYGEGSRFTEHYYDAIDGEKFNQPEHAAGLMLPVDQWVVSFVDHLSGPSGSMTVGRQFSQIHPDYLTELFGQRMGVQVGGKRVALMGKASVPAVYHLTGAANSLDYEGGNARKASPIKADVLLKKPGVFVAVRVSVDPINADQDGNVRFGPGAVRLVAAGANYYPIGAMDGQTFVATRPDDLMFVKGGDAVDLVYMLPAKDVLVTEPGRTKLPSGAFLEFKRLARVDLSGVVVATTPAKPVKLIRKNAPAAATPSQPPPPQSKLSTLGQRLVGTWTGEIQGGGSMTITFGEETVTREVKDPRGRIVKRPGTWKETGSLATQLKVQWMLKSQGKDTPAEDITIKFEADSIVIDGKGLESVVLTKK